MEIEEMSRALLLLSIANPGLLPMAMAGREGGGREHKPTEDEAGYDKETIIVSLLAMASMLVIAFLPYTGLI